jgi:hypothetical protein
MTIPGRRERGSSGQDDPALAVLGEPAEREGVAVGPVAQS